MTDMLISDFLFVCFWEMELIGIDWVSQIARIGILRPNMDEKVSVISLSLLKNDKLRFSGKSSFINRYTYQ